MDIEVAEKEVTQGILDVVKKNRAVMAVCVYHQYADILELSSIIRELDNYCVLFRKYPCCAGNEALRMGELVMYAVPFERMEN